MYLKILCYDNDNEIYIDLFLEAMSKFLDRKIEYKDVKELNINVINDFFSCTLNEDREDNTILYDGEKEILYRVKREDRKSILTEIVCKVSEDEFWDSII